MGIITIIAGALLLGLAAAAVVLPKRSGQKCPVDIVVILAVAGLLVLGLGMIPYKERPELKKAAEMKQALQEMKGNAAPDFSGTDVNGNELALSDYIGKGDYVLLDLWASWCGPCKKYLPIVREVYDEYSGKGLAVLGVNVNDDPEKAKAFISTSDMVWDVMITEGNTVTKLYNCSGIPSCYLISPDGTILEAGVHPVQLKETIKKYFEDEQ